MAITYTFDAQGGFYAHDAERKLIAYAYPTSKHAKQAKTEPDKAAAAMIDNEKWPSPRSRFRELYERRYHAMLSRMEAATKTLEQHAPVS